jgi:hypothetical protein
MAKDFQTDPEADEMVTQYALKQILQKNDVMSILDSFRFRLG